jgi:hypothetical protein
MRWADDPGTTAMFRNPHTKICHPSCLEISIEIATLR